MKPADMNRWHAVIFSVFAISGCAQGPYALVTGRVGASPPFDTSGVVINGVDGQLYFDNQEERRVSPGFHALQVTTTRKSSSSRRAANLVTPTSSYVYLMAEPCVQYFVIAKHESGEAEAKWKPEVLKAEPIDGCNANEEPK